VLTLNGIRVLDLSRYLSGPTLTMLLGDLGADVIKVETLPNGDPSRQSGPFQAGESVYYMASNRNKRSLAVNLRDQRGRELCQTLARRCDVLVENFRPGVIDKMGLGYSKLREDNPGLVYCSISGFGSTPPGSELPGFDQTAQAMSGLMSVTGTEETGPLRAGIAVADSTTGVFGAVGVLAALVERASSGIGKRVECSLMGSMVSLMSYQAQKYLSLGEIPGQDGNDHPLMFPQGTFRAADGQITLASGNEKMWEMLCVVLGVEELATDTRFHDNAARMRNRAELRALLEDALAEKCVDEWTMLLNDAGIPSSAVLNIGQALEHPVADGLRLVEEVVHSSLGVLKVLGTPIKFDGNTDEWLRLPPPLLGEHSVAILEEVGYDSEEVSQLAATGVIHDKNLVAPAQ
jgi:crotonobetainyl-CoA:carnitine CoA-transferase CaiB-like acyl-CoA transferase